MAIWPICLVIVAAVFTYNLVVHTKNMELIKKSASMTVMIKAIGQATCPAIFNPLNAMISQMIGSIANKK